MKKKISIINAERITVLQQSPHVMGSRKDKHITSPMPLGARRDYSQRDFRISSASRQRKAIEKQFHSIDPMNKSK
jgi:hypothetical protein